MANNETSNQHRNLSEGKNQIPSDQPVWFLQAECSQ